MISENTFTFIGRLIGKPRFSKREGKPGITRVNMLVKRGYNTNKIPLIAFDVKAEELHDLGSSGMEIYAKGRVESRERRVKIEVPDSEELKEVILNVPSFVIDQFKFLTAQERWPEEINDAPDTA